MFLVSVTDQVRRLSAPPSRKPVRTETQATPGAARKARAAV
jgi:hypothetical protein